MPKASQYSFSLDEVARILVEKAGITEGKWQFGVEFSVHIGNIGGGPDNVRPGGLLLVQSMTLNRQDNLPSDAPFLIDLSKDDADD